MKKSTLQKRTKIANDILYYIFRHIDTDINIDELSLEMGVSKFHLHRIFKDEFGKNIYELIKSIRLQKASNLLITNSHSTISDIALMCGYSSQTSFLRAFKERFEMTPKEWKNGGYKEYSTKILEASKYALKSCATFTHISPTIIKLPQMKGFYIRHIGYDRSIKQTWQKLQTWILSNDIKDYTELAVHHDNPIITPLNECHYIAVVMINNEEKFKELEKITSLPTFIIPSGVYAKFEVSGIYGDVLKLIQWVYHSWLPNSGYETTTNPSFAIYQKNHFLSSDEEFLLEYYVPIRVV